MLLRSDGKVTLGGVARYGACHLDVEPKRYKQVSAGAKHTLLLTDKGAISASGCNSTGQCDLPKLDVPTSRPANADKSTNADQAAESNAEGLEYIQVFAGAWHSVALRSDGRAVYAGRRHGDPDTSFDPHPSEPRYLIREPEQGCYVQVSAGYSHTALLRSDGRVAAFGSNDSGQCRLPAPNLGNLRAMANISDTGYIQVSAGGDHTVLLSKDGSVEAVGSNRHGQCDVPVFDKESGELPVFDKDSPWRYVRVSAGYKHTLLLRSDGKVDAAGWNKHGQCDIPPLEDGLIYLQASAGAYQSALLRSDGQVIIIGAEYGKYEVPAVYSHQSWVDYLFTKPRLPEGVEYVSDFSELPVGPAALPGRPGEIPVHSNSILVVQVGVEVVKNSCYVRCVSMAGELLTSFEVQPDAIVRDVYCTMMDKLGRWHWRLQAVLSSGQLLKQFRGHEDFLTVAGTGGVDLPVRSWLGGLTSAWSKEEVAEKSTGAPDKKQRAWLCELASVLGPEEHAQSIL